MPLDEDKLHAFVGEKMLPEAGGAWSMVMALIGDKTGLFKAMDGQGPMTVVQVAERSGCAERYVREWLSAMAAAGWIDCNTQDETFELNAEQSMVFANDESPVNMIGFFEVIGSAVRDHRKIVDAFKSGEGVPWQDHSECLFRGVERFFRTGYSAFLVNDWIPALDGVKDRLEAGARVADVGCGHGASTILMAQAFPNSVFHGYDLHPESIDRAREAAEEAGVDNVDFEVAQAKDFPGRDYDLVAYFDCLHDMGDPKGAIAYAKSALKPDGTVMLVEPYANDGLADNLTPVGRLFYSASSCICTPASLSQEVGLALGAQAGEARWREIFEEAGYSRLRRATETPFNLILEAKP